MFDLFSVMKWDWVWGRGKRSISYLSGQLPHCLAVPSPFPSPSSCLILKFSITEVPCRAKECMKIRQKSSGPLPHRTQHTPFQKRIKWKTWGQRDELLSGDGDATWWEEWARGVWEWLGFWWAERLCESRRFRDRILPHLCARHVHAQPEWQPPWASHQEARSRNLTPALIQRRICPVTLPLLLVVSDVAAAEKRCLNTALVGVYAPMVTSPEQKTAALDRNEFPLLGNPWIVPIHDFPISCDGVFRTGSYFTLCLPGVSCQCLKGAFAKKIWMLPVAWLFILQSNVQGLMS